MANLPRCFLYSIIITWLTSFALYAKEVSFLAHLDREVPYSLQQNLPPDLAVNAQSWWRLARENGYVISPQPGEQARLIFSQLQCSLEQEMLNFIKSAPYLGKAIWIFHTPLVATPLVIQPNHASTQVLSIVEKRSALVRQFLAHQGILIVVHQGGRTAAQMKVFNHLKDQYPQQIVELVIKKTEQYPLDKIGATYLMQSNNQVFAMTNRGVQLNDHRETQWGLWLQEKEVEPVRERLAQVFQFLQQMGLNEAIVQHTSKQQIGSDKFKLLY